VNAATVLSSTLSVAKDTVLASTLSVNAATVLSSTLSVAKDTVLSSTLSVSGETTINNHLTVSNDLNLGGILNVDNLKTNTGNDMNIYLGDSGDSKSNNTGTLTVYGNLDVLGSYNQIPITMDDFHVQDKVITLAYSSNNSNINATPQAFAMDGIINNGAGIEIDGIPVGVVTTHDHWNSNLWDKSLKWNTGASGMPYLGPHSTILDDDITNETSIEHEAFWEFKGGSLRLTGYFKETGDNGIDKYEKISYAIRITKNKELQFVKIEGGLNGDNPTYRQVASFGVRF
jgi:hypothetical protein